MRKLTAYLIVSFFFSQCTKDVGIPDDPYNNGECSSFKTCDKGWAVNYYDSTQFKSPCINPNNPDEFIYTYSNSNNTSLNGLYKFTISSGNKQKLTSSSVFPHAKWGKNNWILFSISNGDKKEVHKIKSNGDSLTKLTSGHIDFYPEWDNTNNRIVFNRQVYLGSPASKIMIADINGIILDSINNQHFHYGACNSIGELAFPPFNKRTCGITVVNINDKSESLLNSPSSCQNQNQGICWHPNNQDVYYTTYAGSLYKLNKNTKSQSIIVSFCDTKGYAGISMSPNADFLLVERVSGKYVSCAPWYKSNIYKVTLDGKSETKIILE